RKAFALLKAHYGEDVSLGTVPRDDAHVYDMLCHADSIGVFQVESRAQMNMLPRLKPRCFYDLVIEVAIVRPGPIQGDMVHPYLKRRSGKEAVCFPCPDADHGPPDELERILARTLGVPVFQEQAMKIALDAAKFSPAEANQLRKAMATFRSRGTIDLLQDKMVGRMVERGYDEDFAQRCFHQIRGFGEYGFPESHAASFAHLVYVSSWIRWKYPAAFACALLNSQPMGFYAPAQIVRDARDHGVEVRPVDVNMSEWDCTLEGGALRLGLRQIEGLRAADAALVAAGRPYASVEDLRALGRVPIHAIHKLAAADAFRSIGLDRRAALWDARALRQAPDLPLFVAAEARDEGAEAVPATLPAMPLSEHVVNDYQTVRLSLKAHPLSFLREHYARAGFVTADRLRSLPNGRRIGLAGLVLIRQRPGSAKGVCFITIEDETGIANLIVWPDRFAAQRSIVMGARLMAVHGVVQKDEAVVHVIVQSLEDDSAMLRHLSEEAMPATLSAGDGGGALRPLARDHPRDVNCIPKSRDFH
ncbi:MAG: OB-fold nucleic acid binding domain-containing protein, partial [Sphingomicrobium sp.]